MSEDEIYQKIAGLIQDHFQLSPDKISPSLNFKEDLDADSIDIVEFVLELEDAFGSEIPDDDAENIKTVQDAVDYIKAHQKKNKFVQKSRHCGGFFAWVRNLESAAVW